MIALRDSPFCTSRKIVHNFFLFPPDTSAVPGDIEDNAYAKLKGGGGGWYTRCIVGEVQMANKENIRICIGEKVCNSHGKSKNVIIILF